MTTTYRQIGNALELELYAVRIAESDAQSSFHGSDTAWCAVVVPDRVDRHPAWPTAVAFVYVEGIEWMGLVREPDGTLALDSDLGADFADWLAEHEATDDYRMVGMHTHCLAWARVGESTRVFVWRSPYDLRHYDVLPRERGLR